MVVEQRLQNRGETDKESLQSHSDDEPDQDDSGSIVSNGDGTEDVFFDCDTNLSRLSGTPILSDETSTSGPSQSSGKRQHHGHSASGNSMKVLHAKAHAF